MVTPATMGDKTKPEVYHRTLLKALNTNGELKESLNLDLYQSQFKLIEQNLLSAVKSDRVRALQMLQILIDNRAHTIMRDVLTILKDTSIEENLKSGILDSVNHSMFSTVRELLVNKDVIELASLYALWQNDQSEMFLNIIKSLYAYPGNREHMKTILFDFLIPIMLDTKNQEDSMKVVCIDLALVISKVITITIMDNEEYKVYFGKINEYVTTIATLRDIGFPHWHKLWMFLIRLLGTKLHHSMSLMNKLLRIVEQSFKSPCVEQRLNSYECWKELIDNVSLDKNYLCTEKQIKLLLTPLKAKFAYQTELLVKRFDHFIYLMEKLEEKAVLVVKEFLEFCFGEVGKQLAAPKAKQGKTVPELWLKIVQALVGLMGHSHKDIDHCLNIEPQMHIKPVLCNTSNISHIYPHLINAVFECSKLLKELELNQKRHTLLRCLWRSLFNIVLNSSADNRQTCIDSLSEVLENLLKEIDPYYHGIAIVIFKESVSVDKLDVTDFVLNNLERFLKIIFSVPLSKESCIEVKKFIALLCHVSNLSGKVEDRQKILGRIFNCFKTFQTIESNVNFVADVWIYVVNEAEHYDKGNSLEFLVWPLTNADKLTEQVTRVTVYEYYERLIIKKVEKLPELHFALLKHFERSLRNDPMLLKNVLNLITLFNPNYTAKEICEVTLDIFSFALLIPTDSDTNRKTAEVYLKKILETNSIFLKEESTIKKLCSCIENLLKHRLFDTLTPLETALERFSDNIKNIYKKFLTLDFLVDIFVTETDISITEKVHAIIKQLREAKTTEIKREKSLLVMGGRASKIANLVKQMPVSPKKEQKPNTPFKVFGSQLKNAKTAAKLEAAVSSPADKRKSAISLDDESNSKFVLINSEVKLDKEKLTEHQKETLKKRREDIPALYQDLSQSVSQTEFVQPVVATEGNDSPFFKKPEVPPEVVKLPPDETELVQELPSLPSSTDSSFDDKSKEERPKSAEPQSPSKLKAEEPSLTDSSGRKLRKRACNEKNTAVAEGGATSPKTTKKESSSPKEEKPAKKRGRKPKALLDEMKRIANQLAETKNEVATNEALEANKESAPDPKGEPETYVKTKVKRRNRAKPHFKGNIEVPGETSLKDESEQVTFKIKRRRGRKSLGDIQTDELRKSKRKSLPSSKMSDILQFLKPKSLTPSTNAKRSEPDNNTQSELFPPEEPSNQLENPETEPQKTRKSTSDEDEDIIESSQESGVANASLSKLRLSMNKSGAVKPEEMPQNESVQETIIAEQVDVPTSAEKKPRKRKTATRSKPIKSIVASNRVSAATAALEDLINELDKCESETVAPAVLMGQSEKEETVEVAVADERNEMEMSTEELQQKSTQSQDTESMHLDPDSEKVQVFLDLPVKPVLTDADKEIATMDTATLSLVELEELRSLNNSAASDKTVIEDTTLTNVKKEVEESQSQAETEVIPATEPVAVEETRVELSVAIKTEVDESASVVPETELLNTEMVDDESSPVKSGVSPTCAGTPTASSSSLPSSPITGDTPNRTTELLSNTNDISPIRSKPNNGSSDEETEQRKFVPVALIFDEEVDKEKSPERGDDAPEKMMETSPEKAEKDGHITSISTMPPSSSSSSSSPPPKVEPVEKETAIVGEKTVKGTGNWIKQGTPTTKSMFRRRKAGLSMSPSTSRIKKLMSNVKPPSQTGELAEEFAEADVLTFKRDVPSPLAIPRSSILKRKHSELNEEGSSPYAKRKRVNFSDPCTTSKKVFLKEDPPVRPTTIFTSDDIDKKFMELMGMEDPDLEDTNILDESDIIITIDDPPIYPELMNCEEDLLVLGNLWLSEDKLIDETILTVGDLARQTEKSLAKLSPSRPMALHVFKLLQNYHQEVQKCGKNIFGRPARAKVRHLLDNLPVNGESKRAEDESEVPVDVRTELRRVLEKAKSENITLDSISPIILDIIGEKSLANLLIQIIENDNEELSQCFRLIWSKLVSRLSPTQLMQLTHECQLQIPLKE